jgi:hypothetical protein
VVLDSSESEDGHTSPPPKPEKEDVSLPSMSTPPRLPSAPVAPPVAPPAMVPSVENEPWVFPSNMDMKLVNGPCSLIL